MASPHAGGLAAKVIEDADALERLAPALDRLAVQRSRPYCAAAWLSAWWRYAASSDARLRVVTVSQGDEIVGIAPWVLSRERLGVRTLRPMGSPIFQGVEPLAVPGRDRDVAAVVAAALAAGDDSADLLAFEGIDRRSRWPEYLAAAWPGGPAAMLTRYELPTFSMSVPADLTFSSWFSSKSRNFRSNLGYKRRRFVRQGGGFRVATSETLERDLRAFARLHRSRWASRGGSAYMSDQVERLLADAGRALIPAGRFRLWSLEIDGEVISSQLALRAGTEYAYWLGGFDEGHATLSPSLLGILRLIEDAFECGARRIDFAGGSADWKTRFADDEGTLAWRRVVPRGPGHVRARLSLAPGHWRRGVANRVPSEVRGRVIRLERRLLRH